MALLALLGATLAIYGPAAVREGVVVAKAKDFKEIVLDSKEPVAVQFFAPWCGHCKSLKPAWKAATKALQGKGIKLVVVDATTEQSLAQKYEVRGYPTIKIFGGSKKPTSYDGARDADSLIREFKRIAKGGGGGKAEKGGGSEAKPKPKPERPRPSGGGGGGGGGASQGFAPRPAIEPRTHWYTSLFVFFLPFCSRSIHFFNDAL